MRIGLTGTPGTGKTTVATVAARHGHDTANLHELARRHGCIAGRDERDDADVIDVECLASRLGPPAADQLVEGHLAHFLPVAATWVLRLDPVVLRRRLEARGYPAKKVDENVEAEALDLILQEAQAGPAPVYQVDGTRRTPDEIYKTFVEMQGESPKRSRLEPVDWSHRL